MEVSCGSGGMRTPNQGDGNRDGIVTGESKSQRGGHMAEVEMWLQERETGGIVIGKSGSEGW